MLINDIAIADTMRKINYDCQHPLAVILIKRLRAFATGTLINMWQEDRLFKACKGKLPPPSRSWRETAPEFLKQVAVSAAVRFVATKLRTWKPDRGASINTYFMTFVLFEFKDQYIKDQTWRQHEVLSEPDAWELATLQAPDDPALEVIRRVTIAEALSIAESMQMEEIVKMWLIGTSQPNIAKSLDVSLATVERRLKDFREALRNGWNEGSGAE